jgi:predicted DNA-binding protein YlxM (UPF0122 family)
MEYYMHYIEEPLSVREVADILETEPTFVYKLIREGSLKTFRSNPITIQRLELVHYLNNRIPNKTFRVEFKDKSKLGFAYA